MSEKKQAKYDAILKEAKIAFLEVGYVATKMDQVAKDAEVTKQTIYRYFPSKIELFEAVLQQISKQEAPDLVLTFRKADPLEDMVEFAVRFMKFHLSDTHLKAYRLILTESKMHPEIFEKFHKIGPNPMAQHLLEALKKQFLDDKLEEKMELWLSMLLAPRNRQLIQSDTLSDDQIQDHATLATKILLKNLVARDR